MKRLEGSASKKLVISRYDDFVPMWQFTEPIIEVGDCFHTLGEHGEIASVDEDVAVGHIHLAMKLMCIAEENKAQFGSPYRRPARLWIRFHTLISSAGRMLGNIPQTLFFPEDPRRANGPPTQG
jgi:hypothetical protein